MAKAIIGGDAKGAEAAAARTVKGYKDIERAAKSAGKASTDAAKTATAADKRFEAQVQKSIGTIKRRQMAVKARGEAEKRLGIGAGPGAGRARGPRGQAVSAPGGSRRAQMAGQGLALLGTTSQGGFGQVASMAGATAGAAAGLGIGAGLVAVVGGVINAYQQHRQELRQAFAGEIQARNQISDALKQARRQRAQGGIDEWRQSGNQAMLAAMAGRDPRSLIGHGIDRKGAMDLGQLLAGVDSAIRPRISGVMQQISRLGGTPDSAALERVMIRLRRRGGLSAGTQFGPASDAALVQSGLGRGDIDVAAVQDALAQKGHMGTWLRVRDRLNGAEGSHQRALLGRIWGDSRQMQDEIQRQTRGVMDPEGAALGEIREGMQRQIEVQRALLGEDSPLLRKMQEVVDGLRASGGGFSVKR